MPARPVPTIGQIHQAFTNASAGRGRALIELLRAMPIADLESGIARYGLALESAMCLAVGRMEMRAEMRAGRKIMRRAPQ